MSDRRRSSSFFGRRTKRRDTGARAMDVDDGVSVISQSRMNRRSSGSSSLSSRSSFGRVRGRKRSNSNVSSFVRPARLGTSMLKPKRKRSRKGKRSLKQRLVALEKSQQKWATHELRHMSGAQLTFGSSVANYVAIGCFNSSHIETAMDNLAYLDRSATPALDTINLLTSGYGAQDIKVKDLYGRMTVRNNNEVDAIVDIYMCQAKSDDSEDPLQVQTSDDANYQAVGLTLNAQTDVMLFPTDFSYFKKMWKIVGHTKGHLRSGDELHLTYTQKERTYDPSHKDINTESFQRGDTVWLIRAQGVVGHSALVEEDICLTDGSLDYVNYRKHTIKYKSDAAFHKIETVNQLATPTDAEAAGPAVDAGLEDVQD